MCGLPPAARRCWVTDRDRVVAELGPPSSTRSSLVSDALLVDAFRQGWMPPPISVKRGDEMPDWAGDKRLPPVRLSITHISGHAEFKTDLDIC
jgi:hypothetical protein